MVSIMIIYTIIYVNVYIYDIYLCRILACLIQGQDLFIYITPNLFPEIYSSRNLLWQAWYE